MTKEKLLLSRSWKARQSSSSTRNEDSLSKLQADGRITAEQAKAYKDYHAKQKQVKLLQIKAFTMLESP